MRKILRVIRHIILNMVVIRVLNDDLKKIAEKELNEIESRIPDNVALLREWIQKQPHLSACTSDQFLVSFLRGCKYSLEKAKSKLDYFYTLQAALPELFANKRVDEKCIKICRAGTYVCLPKPLGAGGSRILLNIFSKFDSKQFNINDLLRYQSLLMYAHLHEDDNLIISGYVQIIDLSNLNMALAAQFDPVLIKKLGVMADKAAPMRMKGVHFINCSKESLFLMFNMARSLLSKKIQQRFYLHKTLDELYKVVPRIYLPVEYGGTNGSIAEIQAETERRLIEYNKYFIEDAKYGVNEKLRPGKKFDANTLFGIEGSFRKLEID